MVSELFAGRLRELRTAMGLSQSELADKVGVNVRQISRMETAAQVPTWPIAVALAGALGVGVEAFTIAPQSSSSPTPKRGRPRKGAAPERESAKAGKKKRTKGKK